MKNRRILIADDHSAIRAGLVKILSSEFPQLEFGEAEYGEQVIGKITSNPNNHWDVLILDIGLKGINGLEVLRQLHKIDPKIAVLIFSIYPEDQMAIRCLKGGAQGFLNKAASEKEIIGAVDKVLNGKKYYSDYVKNIIMDEIGHLHEHEPHERLSNREYEILLLIGEGHSITTIAERVKLSISTVNTYRSRILKKMHLLNNAGIINYVIKNQLRPY